MNNNLVKVKLHGELGKEITPEWELKVNSVQSAIYAINSLTNNKFNDYFIKNDKLQDKYRILINGRDFTCTEKELNEKNWEKVSESELVMKKKNLKTIDIVPLIESSDPKLLGSITAILGIILIIVGFFLLATGWGVPLIIAGLTLLGAGVVALLSKPPTFPPNQPPQANSQSYLFSGPVNTVGEGNPVPVGYGRLMVGSNVISASYQITESETVNTSQ